MRSLIDKQYSSIPDGFDIINDTNLHKGNWQAIQIVDSPAFPDNNIDNIVGNESKNLFLQSNILPTGMVIYGNWKQIKLTAGTVFAYKG